MINKHRPTPEIPETPLIDLRSSTPETPVISLSYRSTGVPPQKQEPSRVESPHKNKSRKPDYEHTPRRRAHNTRKLSPNERGRTRSCSSPRVTSPASRRRPRGSSGKREDERSNATRSGTKRRHPYPTPRPAYPGKPNPSSSRQPGRRRQQADHQPDVGENRAVLRVGAGRLLRL